MSNRQARREQRKGSRNAQRGQRPRNSQRQSSPQPVGGGGGGGFFSLPYLIGVGVLIVALGGVIGFMALTGDDSDYGEDLHAAEENFPEDLADGTAVGDPDAPIELISFIDFRCPFCLRVAAEDEPDLIEEYVREGHLRIETRHMPVIQGDGSTIAAEAAQCAAQQDAFWPMHNRLFLAHDEDGTGTGVFSTDAMKDYADDIGLDRDEFDACVDNRETNDEVLEHRSSAQAYGFTGTPSFVINEQPLQGAPSGIEGWRQILDALLEDLDQDGEVDPEDIEVEPNGEQSEADDADTGDDDEDDDE